MVSVPVAKAGSLGLIPSGCFGFFFSSWLTNVDGMKDLWCSNTVWLLSLNIDMKGEKDLWCSIGQFGCYQHIDVNGLVCGVLVQLGCYQQRHK